MEIAGTHTIAAPRQEVWAALNDPIVLQRCLPGCESVEPAGIDQFRAVVAASIGPLRARFNGVLRLTEAMPPLSCVLVFEGQGGAIGFGKGSAEVALHDAGASTELSYTARAQVGGKLAQVGSRLIDSVVRKMSDDFFQAFGTELASRQAAVDAAAAGLQQSAASAPHAAGRAPRARGVWVALAAAIVVILGVAAM
jgi:carbon monoxide dehydrogenase subunit G